MLWNKDIPTITLSPSTNTTSDNSEESNNTNSNNTSNSNENIQPEEPLINSIVTKGSGWLKLIAGRVNQVKANVEKSTPLSYFHVKLDPATQWTYYVPHDHHALAIVLKGIPYSLKRG